MDPRRYVPKATAVVLAVLSALHLAWAFGSAFPFRDRDALAERVVGATRVPGPAACVSVSGALLGAAALVADVHVVPRRLRRPGVLTVITVLLTRATVGLAGRTDIVAPGSTSAAFRRQDRRIYSPLCLALAVGSAISLRVPRSDG